MKCCKKNDSNDTDEQPKELTPEEKKKSKIILVIGVIVSIGMSIYSFVNVYLTYLELVEIKDDYLTLINHWESKPVTDIKLIEYTDDTSCPTGYKEGIVKDNDRKVDQTIGKWPGKYKICMV